MLSSTKYLKVGIAAFEDALKLQWSYQIEAANIFDLTFLSKELEINSKGEITRSLKEDKSRGILVVRDDDAMDLSSGLKVLFYSMFTAKFGELESIPGHTYPLYSRNYAHMPRNKWTTYPLLLKDLAYAAKDAIFGSLLYNAMIIKFNESEVAKLKSAAIVELRRRKLKKERRGAVKAACFELPAAMHVKMGESSMIRQKASISTTKQTRKIKSINADRKLCEVGPVTSTKRTK